MASKPDFKRLRKRLFPEGTDGLGSTTAPEWPPDLFAFAALCAEELGVYAEYAFNAGWDTEGYAFDNAHLAEVTRLAELWNSNLFTPEPIHEAWNRVMNAREYRRDWRQDIMLMLTVADEASSGVGFQPPPGGLGAYSHIVFQALAEKQQGIDPGLPHLPGSLCWQVPPSVLCVQPKTNTPSVGCTLRSSSNNLALLPPASLVATSWLYAAPADTPTPHLNTLLIPFPYRLEGGDFHPVGNPHDPKNSFFTTAQPWLVRSGLDANTVVAFLSAMIVEAERESGTVHAVVLPELALDGETIEQVAAALGARHVELELFIAGILDHDADGRERNCAYTVRYFGGEMAHRWRQPKHHRWKLEQNQIKRYSFGYALDPERDWWECIDVSNRSCAFSVIRPGATIATLVCEDLARFDPVMPVINAVGPTLLVGLLMDGPQWESRWPGRYATVLAEDPGCSVLTVTSLGMIRRSTPPGKSPPCEIALWKEPGAAAESLTLPANHHGLLLALTLAPDPRQTLDRRVDRAGGARLRLSGVQGVKLQTLDDFPDLEVSA